MMKKNIDITKIMQHRASVGLSYSLVRHFTDDIWFNCPVQLYLNVDVFQTGRDYDFRVEGGVR